MAEAVRQGERVAEPWRDEEYARAWMAADSTNDLLQLPMAIAATLIAEDRPGAALVIDVGSGPGAFLSALLDALPEARGVWIDASEAMEAEARQRLAAYGDRVEFHVADMTRLGEMSLPDGADAVTTSRAVHHLDAAGVAAYYASAAALTAPGGWVVNLDHIAAAPQWDRQYRAIRPRFNRRPPSETPHRHDRPLPGLEDHLRGLAEAGLDADVAWRAFYTCLFVSRRAGAGDGGS